MPAELGAGLVFALRIEGDGQALEIGREAVAAELLGGTAFLWLHLNLGNARVQEWLRTTLLVPRDARELLRDPREHTRLRPVADGFAGVLADLRQWRDGDARRVATFRFVTLPRLVLTGRVDPLHTLSLVRTDVEAGRVVGGPVALTARIIRGLASSLDELVDDLEGQLEELEPGAAKERDGRIRRKLTRLRLTARSARRHIAVRRHAVMQVCGAPPAWLTPADVAGLRDAIDHLAAVGEDLEDVDERATLLQEEITGRLAHATSRNLYILSIISALFMPMTLVTGIFGMNVAGLPWLEEPLGFLFAVLLTTGIGLIGLLVLRLIRLA